MENVLSGKYCIDFKVLLHQINISFSYISLNFLKLPIYYVMVIYALEHQDRKGSEE